MLLTQCSTTEPQEHLKGFKGIVHPKPQVVPNLYECLCSAEHKGRYSEEFGKQSSSGAPLTSMVFFSYYGNCDCVPLGRPRGRSVGTNSVCVLHSLACTMNENHGGENRENVSIVQS